MAAELYNRVLRHFALRFFHSHSGATGVFCLICRTVRCRGAANLIAASSKIGVRRLKVRDLLIQICVHCALLCRHHHHIFKTRPRTKFSSKLPNHNFVNIWNEIDENLKSCSSKVIFKLLLRKGSFTIIDIYESVHSVRFLMTPSPLPKSVL